MLKRKRTGIFTKIIILVLAFYTVGSLVHLRIKIQDAKDGKSLLEQQIEEQAAKNDELKYAIENSDDEDIIEGVARDRLGLVMPDEHIYYND